MVVNVSGLRLKAAVLERYLKRVKPKNNTLDEYLMALVKMIALVSIIILVPLAVVKPQSLADLWMTRDQQGQWLFNRGQYEAASRQFVNARWQAYSLYGAEQFDNAALLYSQYADADNLLAYGNALAHASRYVKARDAYKAILEQYPEFSPAQKNVAVIQRLIDDINRMSESQRPEGNSKELGDEPVRADGAEKKETRVQEVEQLTSEQILLDPELNDMWLRQVQKDPGRFLALKFQAQLDSQKTASKAGEANRD